MSIHTSFYTEIYVNIGLSSRMCVYSYLHLRKHLCERKNVRICNDAPVDQFLVLLANSYIILSEVNMSVHISRNAQTNGAACVHTCTIFSTGEDTLFLFFVAEHRLTFQSSQFLWHLALRPVDANDLLRRLFFPNETRANSVRFISSKNHRISSNHTTSTLSEVIVASPATSLKLQSQTNQIGSAKVAASVTKSKTPTSKPLGCHSIKHPHQTSKISTNDMWHHYMIAVGICSFLVGTLSILFPTSPARGCILLFLPQTQPTHQKLDPNTWWQRTPTQCLRRHKRKRPTAAQAKILRSKRWLLLMASLLEFAFCAFCIHKRLAEVTRSAWQEKH